MRWTAAVSLGAIVTTACLWVGFGEVDGGSLESPPSSPGLVEAAEAVGLADIIHLPFGYLSAGQQRRMAMAKLIVAFRPIWLLDEPTAALDVSADRLFAGLVAAHLDRGGVVVAATHQPLGFAGAKSLEMTGFVH